MAGKPEVPLPSTWRLILVPAVISLAVTLLRLAGELGHLSKLFFNSQAGGLWAIVGITWLAPVFGVYFAVKMVRAGAGPASLLRAVGIGVLGWVVMFAGQVLAARYVFPHGFKVGLIAVWASYGLAGLLQWAGWPRLFKVLFAYAYAARVPVTVVMLLAFWRHWGTHYDAFPPHWTSAGVWSDFFWLGFVPQLTLWAGYTIAAGALFGSLTACVLRLFRRAPRPPAA